MKHIRHLFLLFWCLYLSCVEAQELTDFFSQTESFKRAHVGICIVDLETGKEVYSCEAERYFNPASLQKIPISAVAVATLGENFQFTTDLERVGEVDKEGVLNGDLVIRGGGDPTLSLEALTTWENALKKEGIKQINGQIFVDATHFESSLASPYWSFEDLGNYYGAGASALTINDNLYHVTFQSGAKEGEPASIVKSYPHIPNLIIHNEILTGPIGSGDQAYVFGVEYSPVQFYRGTVPLDQKTFTIKAAIPDPPLFCGNALCDRVKALKGVAVIRDPLQKIPTGKIISRIKSSSLKEIIQQINLRSVNLYAEALLKAIGSGNSRQGTIKVKEFLQALHIPSQIKDGAGLARTNLMTPKGFSELLCRIRRTPLYCSIYDSLPEANKTGTLQSFPKIAGGTLKAKTGSMGNVYNLGGYLTLNSGKEYAVSLFCNNYEGSLSDIKKEMGLFLNAFAKKQDQP